MRRWRETFGQSLGTAPHIGVSAIGNRAPGALRFGSAASTMHALFALAVALPKPTDSRWSATIPLERDDAKPTVSRFADTSAIPPHFLLEWPPPAPYSNVVKDLGVAAAKSAAACEAACVAYRNSDVSPVSGWTRCTSYTRTATRCDHAVFHSQIEGDDERLCGGHAYSQDGVSWTFTGTSWSNRVMLRPAGGAPYLYLFSRRERPHLVFGKEGAIEALTTGVQFGAHAPTSVGGEDACFTLLQPVRRRASASAE